MPQQAQNLIALIGRILLCLIFLNSAYHKLTGWEDALGYMESRGLPAAQVGLVIAVVLEIAGGLSLLLGLKARVGAVLLILFMIPTLLYFHNFWTYPADAQRGQVIHFMKNITIMGGLLMVLAHGAGGWSIDGRRRKGSS